MKKNKFILLSLIVLIIAFPSNIFAAEITNIGSYNVAGGTKSDYLIEYDNMQDNNDATITANITGDYIYQTSTGSLGIVNLGNYGINGKNDVIVNGNLKFIRSDASENDFYGLELYANSNMTLNGDFTTSQTGIFADSHSIFGYGINSEARSNLILNKNLTIDKIYVKNTSGKSQSTGIIASSKDNTTASSYEGTSTITMPDENSKATISNISAISDNNKAVAIGISSSGEANNTCSNSNIDIKSDLTIDTVSAKGVNDEAYGILSSVLGSTNLSGNVDIKNISSSTKESYAVTASYGGIVNINDAKNKDVTIKGDIWSLNCFNDENDASIVNINLSNSNSSLVGATMTDDDSNDGIFGIINMSITNDAVWNVINRTRVDGKNNISEITNLYLNNAMINMFNDAYDSNQEVHVKNTHDLQGNLEINSDVLNITGSNKGDYVLVENNSGTSQVKVDAYDKNASTLANKTFKQWFATTPDSGIEFVPGSAIIDGVTYYPIIEHDNKISGNGKLDWYIVGYTTDEQYTLIFNTNGGEAIESITGSSGKEITLDEIPKKDGYTFDGWYEDEALTNKITEVTLVDKDITVYAKWIKNENPIINPNNPFTGDNIIPWLLVCGLTIIAIIYLIYIFKKTNKYDEKDLEIKKKINKKRNQK